MALDTRIRHGIVDAIYHASCGTTPHDPDEIIRIASKIASQFNVDTNVVLAVWISYGVD